MNKLIALCSFMLVMMISSNSLAAESGKGTLTVTFKYKDSSGFEQPLSDAYVYLNDVSKKPHVDRVFNKPSYILGPSDLSGRITVGVPEGSYYIRITKRNPQNESMNTLGPPESMDYTWSQTTPITIHANVTTDLGITYAGFFTAPISVTGTVTRTTGDPAAGLYVRAQPEPNGDNSNQRGSGKFIAWRRTDANGQYALALRDPGTYSIYVSTCLGGQDGSMPGASPCVGEYDGMVTVNLGDTEILNIVTYF